MRGAVVARSCQIRIARSCHCEELSLRGALAPPPSLRSGLASKGTQTGIFWGARDFPPDSKPTIWRNALKAVLGGIKTSE